MDPAVFEPQPRAPHFMLESTFIHLPGISQKQEQELWLQGILTLEQLRDMMVERLRPKQGNLFPEGSLGRRGRISRLGRALEESAEALAKGDAEYFASRLPPREHFRIALSFPREVAFLDIETTGLSHYYNSTTVIGVSMGGEYRSFLAGQKVAAIKEFLAQAKCLVTFNGKIFDLRFLRKEFPELKVPLAHVDLRFFARRAGLSGGQKAIEAKLGLVRPTAIDDIAGENAPVLWADYRAGSINAAKSLINYNHSDVEGMRTILDASIRKILEDVKYPKSKNISLFCSSVTSIQFSKSKKTEKKNRIYVPRYRGPKGADITYGELATDQRSESLRVVGIDLTGSEARPTGWCVLRGKKVETRLLATDQELINCTVDAHPDVVSIDSPLSLPIGRTRVTDDDPGRQEFGIMRQCERELKRRGVNVYPSLIPSMQRLTARGIQLAAALRERGLPVIESYPGAAQDIMGIQRKRKGLQHLTRGLLDFGVDGSIRNGDLSHDELDAVTSAIVGLFFWSGKFEALGNDAEEYLVIPDLIQSPEGWRSRKVIGISGRISSGKTTAARYLEGRGYGYGRFSMVLKKMLEAEGMQVDRDSLQELGARVHRDPGQRWLSKQLLKLMPETGDLVVDGLRFPEDHAFLVETFGPAFLHVHITAGSETRRARYVQLGYAAVEFDKADHHDVEAESSSLGALAHVRVRNEASLKGFPSILMRAIRAHKR